MIIPDVNLLVYAHNESSGYFKSANKWWRSVLVGEETVLLPWVVMSGFIRVTASKALVSPVSIEQSSAIVEQWLEQSNVSIIEPGSKHLQLIRELSKSSNMPGTKLTDLQIAALAIEHSATIYTHDTDFLRISGIKVEFPLKS